VSAVMIVVSTLSYGGRFFSAISAPRATNP